MKTEKIKFKNNGVYFVVNVTYTEESMLPHIWEAEILEPIKLSAGRSHKSGVCYAMGVRNRKLVLNQDDSLTDEKNEINIYKQVVDSASYNYFNQDNIQKYGFKIEEIYEKINLKYDSQLETLKKNKIESKKKFKKGEITEPEYILALKEKEDVANKISKLKFRVYDSYFECGKLKSKYLR